MNPTMMLRINDDDRYLFPVSERELTALFKEMTENRMVVDVAFGGGGAALIWVKGELMPEAVRHLGLMRGVLNENCDGAGI